MLNFIWLILRNIDWKGIIISVILRLIWKRIIG